MRQYGNDFSEMDDLDLSGEAITKAEGIADDLVDSYGWPVLWAVAARMGLCDALGGCEYRNLTATLRETNTCMDRRLIVLDHMTPPASGSGKVSRLRSAAGRNTICAGSPSSHEGHDRCGMG